VHIEIQESNTRNPFIEIPNLLLKENYIITSNKT
jgi:hypothetical protein